MIGGNLVFDPNFNRASTIVLQKDGKETWVRSARGTTCAGSGLSKERAMKREVVAEAAAMGNDINSASHVSVYGYTLTPGSRR